MGNINYFRINRYNVDRYEIFEDGYYDSDDIDELNLLMMKKRVMKNWMYVLYMLVFINY